LSPNIFVKDETKDRYCCGCLRSCEEEGTSG
jgi:hypothetical protein